MKPLCIRYIDMQNHSRVMGGYGLLKRLILSVDIDDFARLRQYHEKGMLESDEVRKIYGDVVRRVRNNEIFLDISASSRTVGISALTDLIKQFTTEEFTEYKNELTNKTFVRNEIHRLLDYYSVYNQDLGSRIMDLMEYLPQKIAHDYKGMNLDLQFVRHYYELKDDIPISFQDLNEKLKLRTAVYVKAGSFRNEMAVEFPYDLKDLSDVERLFAESLDDIWDDALLRNSTSHFWHTYLGQRSIREAFEHVTNVQSRNKWSAYNYNHVMYVILSVAISKLVDNLGGSIDEIGAIKTYLPENVYTERSSDEVVVFNHHRHIVLKRCGGRYVRVSDNADIGKRCKLFREMNGD